jgi:hypothetical protein
MRSSALGDALLTRLLTAHDVRIEKQAPREISSVGLILFMGRIQRLEKMLAEANR